MCCGSRRDTNHRSRPRQWARAYRAMHYSVGRQRFRCAIRWVIVWAVVRGEDGPRRRKSRQHRGAGASPTRHAAAMSANPPPAVVPAAKLKASQRAIMSYWTPARMASAKPAQPALSGVAAHGSKAANAGNTADGRPGLAGGYVPGGMHAEAALGTTINTSAQSHSVLPADGGYPGPNDTYNWMGPQTNFRSHPSASSSSSSRAGTLSALPRLPTAAAPKTWSGQPVTASC